MKLITNDKTVEKASWERADPYGINVRITTKKPNNRQNSNSKPDVYLSAENYTDLEDLQEGINVFID